MAAAQAPVGDHRKPATKPEQSRGRDDARRDPSEATETARARATSGAGSMDSGPESSSGKQAATTSQQRFDRMAVRAKLAVSQPGDAVEREADAVADQVMRMAEARPVSGVPDGAGKSADAESRKSPMPSVSAGTPQPRSTDGTQGGVATGTAGAHQEVARDAAHGDADGPAEVPADFMARLGPGDPLEADVRARFEQRLGRDLGDVRVHVDALADEAARLINARAFTFGHHIAFAAGQYQPGTAGGDRLIAHELAHVLQQRRSVVRQVMREPANKAAEKVDVKGVKIPTFKFSYFSGKTFERPPGYNRAEKGSKQLSLWKKQTATARAQFASTYGLAADGVYVAVPKTVKLAPGSKDLLLGQPAALAEMVAKPRWDASGKPENYDVDHMVELQIGGEAYDKADNLELRDATANRSSGALIDGSINTELAKIKDTENGDAEKIRAHYTLVFSEFTSGGGPAASTQWDQEAINRLDAAKNGLNVYDPDLNTDQGLLLAWPKGVDKAPFFGGPDLFVLYPSKAGGDAVQIKLNADKKPLNPNQLNAGWIPGFQLSGFDLNLKAGDSLGTLNATLDVPHLSATGGDAVMSFPIRRLGGKLDQAGFISTIGARNKIARAFGVKQMSLVEITELDIQPGTGLLLEGVITPSLPLLDKTPIDLLVTGKRLQVSKNFNADQLNLPGPFRITGSSLTVALSSDAGFSVTGVVAFALQGLGEGTLVGKGGMQAFSIAGDFAFDPKLFDSKTLLRLSYAKAGEGAGKFSGEADIVVGNKIRGIKSAEFKFRVDNDNVEASGDAIPDVPGLKRSAIKVTYAERVLSIGGAVGIDDKVPGVASTDVKVEAKLTEAGWKVAASGQVTPRLPGLSGATLNFSYDDGLVLMQGEFSIKKGPLDGKVMAGVTNAAVDAQGKRAERGAGDTFSVFGAAEIDMVLIKDKLTGKVKLRLLPDGSVRVGGQLEPGDFEVFGRYPADEKKRELFGITINTPMVPLPGFGVSVGGVAVGVNFSASGSAAVFAYIGPGKLTGIAIGVDEFDPAQVDPDAIRVTGHGQFVVYGNAGLSLSAQVNVILAAAVAQLRGSIGVSAKAGLPDDKPFISARAEFSYSKAQGLDVGGTLDLRATPEVKFALFGQVAAELNLVCKKVTLWSKDWTLAEANYKLPLGINATGALSYNSRTHRFKPDNLADAIHVNRPELDAKTLTGVLTGDSAPPPIHDVDPDGEGEAGVCAAEDEPLYSEDTSTSPAGPNASVMPKARSDAEAGPERMVDPGLAARLGAGLELDAATRAYFEQRMRVDLTRVRFHAGPRAAREAARLNARAFTLDEDIVFGEGEYRPHTPEGRELIAHELAHVAQRQGGGEIVVGRWPAVERTSARTAETPASVRAMSLAGFVNLTRTQLDWATSPDLQADAGALAQFRSLRDYSEGPQVEEACGGLNVGDILARGVPAVYAPLDKYRDGVTRGATAWLRRTDDAAKAVRWGRELDKLEAVWPADNLSLVMRAPEPMGNPSPFEKLVEPATPELPQFIAYLRACAPVLSASNGKEVDSFLALRAEGATPATYLGAVRHARTYHHFTKATLDGLRLNEAFPMAAQQITWTRRPLTVVLYPAVDHNGAFHRNRGLERLVADTSHLTIVVEGLATVGDYRATLAPVAARYGVNGRIEQAMVAGHGNATVLALAGTADASVHADRLGTRGTAGTATTDLMTELTRLMSGDPARRRIVLDACLTGSHQVDAALRAPPAEAAADVQAAIAGNPNLRDFVANIAGPGAPVFGANASFAPASTAFQVAGASDLSLSVPGDPALVASKLEYVEFGTEPLGCMRALLECWAADRLAGTHACRDAVGRRLLAGRSTRVAVAFSWYEGIIQPLYRLAHDHYWDNGEALRRMGALAGGVAELYWPHHTSAAALVRQLAVLGDAAHVGMLLGRLAAESHYAARPRVAVVIEQAWMRVDPARRPHFLTALGRYASALQAASDVDMNVVMPHVSALLTLPPPVPPPAAQLRVALMAARHAPLSMPPPAAVPAHVAFLRGLLGNGPRFPSTLDIDTALGGLSSEGAILAAIGRPLTGPRASAAGESRPPPPAANIDTTRDAAMLNDFRVEPLRAEGEVATVRHDLMVRSTPTERSVSNIFARLPFGARVRVIGRFQGWYAIEQPGRSGFVAARYIRLLP